MEVLAVILFHILDNGRESYGFAGKVLRSEISQSELVQESLQAS